MSDIEVIDRRFSAQLTTSNDDAATTLQKMAASGLSAEQMNAFYTLQERIQINRDKMEFQARMAAFRINTPVIVKDSHVSFINSKNQETAYDHASIGQVAKLIGEGLAAVGISHGWKTDQVTHADRIAVTCTLSYGLYSESTMLMASRDDSGGKNFIQSIVSTVTYLERHTLTAASGMATHDQDDDGRSSELAEGVTERVKLISEAKDAAAVMGLYKEAYTLAETAKDKAAMNLYIEAKDKRLAELDTEDAVKQCVNAPTLEGFNAVAKRPA